MDYIEITDDFTVSINAIDKAAATANKLGQYCEFDSIAKMYVKLIDTCVARLMDEVDDFCNEVDQLPKKMRRRRVRHYMHAFLIALHDLDGYALGHIEDEGNRENGGYWKISEICHEAGEQLRDGWKDFLTL